MSAASADDREESDCCLREGAPEVLAYFHEFYLQMRPCGLTWTAVGRDLPSTNREILKCRHRGRVT